MLNLSQKFFIVIFRENSIVSQDWKAELVLAEFDISEIFLLVPRNIIYYLNSKRGIN